MGGRTAINNLDVELTAAELAVLLIAVVGDANFFAIPITEVVKRTALGNISPLLIDQIIKIQVFDLQIIGRNVRRKAVFQVKHAVNNALLDLGRVGKSLHCSRGVFPQLQFALHGRNRKGVVPIFFKLWNAYLGSMVFPERKI